MTILLTLAILAGAALYLMTPEERRALRRAALAGAIRTARAATLGPPPGEPFDDFLVARTRWTAVTPCLIALNTLVFVLMLFGDRELGDPQALVDWGANIALRTTNGEWWRLVASAFVHAGLLHLLATMAALVPLGFILERAIGPLAFASAYLAAATAASLVSLWTTPAMSVSAGASGAIFGLYGLLLSAIASWVIGGRPVPIPPLTRRRVGAAAGVFLLYNLLADDLGTTSELAGMATGFACGLVTARGVARATPPLRQTAAVAAAAVLMAIGGAVPLRGVVDVAPEIARVVDVEERTAGAYDAAVARFRRHRITADALARMIDRTILPELRTTRARLTALHGVPREHRPLVAAAEEYVRLREESWRRRARGLLQSDMRMLRDAEETERAALHALQTLRPAG